MALLLWQPALAQDAPLDLEQASIDSNAIAIATATSYTQIPAGTALDVSTGLSTELASDAVELTSGTLKQGGYTISRDAPYALDVTAVLVRGVGQEQNAPRATQGSVRGDQYTNSEKSAAGDPLTQGNFFDNTRGAFLSPVEVQRGGHLLRVSLSVYDRKSGLYVWRGQIERDSLQVNVDSSMQQMVPALLAHFGESLPATAVPLK
ncbi:hypothetical protein [Dongia deserti]|uniref:hypothetical protein n=1 Tax=Dongia deserti TaxID=2268030 RepID=UPI002547B633|nr:hypothetical protein [Dongia deserti]